MLQPLKQVADLIRSIGRPQPVEACVASGMKLVATTSPTRSRCSPNSLRNCFASYLAHRFAAGKSGSRKNKPRGSSDCLSTN